MLELWLYTNQHKQATDVRTLFYLVPPLFALLVDSGPFCELLAVLVEAIVNNKQNQMAPAAIINFTRFLECPRKTRQNVTNR